MGKIDKINEIIETKKNIVDNKNEKFVKDILIIEINSSYFGIQLEYLREVLEIQDHNMVVPIPYTPSYLLGIMNLRGDIIPVISILEILGIPEKEEDAMKMVILDHRFRVAFPINNIIDLESVDVKNMKEMMDATRKPEEQFLSLELEYEGKRVSVIDIYKIYSSHYLK